MARILRALAEHRSNPIVTLWIKKQRRNMSFREKKTHCPMSLRRSK
jgi:hypothetical protein